MCGLIFFQCDLSEMYMAVDMQLTLHMPVAPGNLHFTCLTSLLLIVPFMYLSMVKKQLLLILAVLVQVVKKEVPHT